MSAPGDDALTVVKIMGLSRAEFAASVRALAPEAAHDAVRVRIPLDTGDAEIAYEALPEVRLGGLLAMPRARVTLSFAGVPAATAAAFVRRFDIAFQRGGG